MLSLSLALKEGKLAWLTIYPMRDREFSCLIWSINMPLRGLVARTEDMGLMMGQTQELTRLISISHIKINLALVSVENL